MGSEDCGRPSPAKREKGTLANMPRQLAHVAIRTYQLTLSSLIGRQCRYLPSCSEYTDDAIQAHGLWMGGWMGLARICRCNPWGGSGYDPAPNLLPEGASPLTPWRSARWRCEAVD
jgi:putative membrane protein insertion efficiency factor